MPCRIKVIEQFAIVPHQLVPDPRCDLIETTRIRTTRSQHFTDRRADSLIAFLSTNDNRTVSEVRRSQVACPNPPMLVTYDGECKVSQCNKAATNKFV